MGRIRIVAGEFRGRRIDVPDRVDVRPTADRVREALFSILGATVRGARVLDLFAGSGALGLEALSRGAAHVTFVESDAAVRRVLSANVDALGVASRTNVVAGDVIVLLDRGRLEGGPWGLVLADPPYRVQATTAVLEGLIAGRCLAEGARVVVELDADHPVDERLPEPAVHVRRARYGRVALDFFNFPGSPE